MKWAACTAEGRIEMIGTAGADATFDHMPPDLTIIIGIDADISSATHYYDNVGAFIEFPPKPARYYNWDWATKQWTSDLAEARRVRRLEINGEQERRNTLPIQYVGLWFEADAAAMRFILGIQTQLLNGVVLPPGFTWRTVTNAPHPADAAFVNGLGRAILLRSASLYQAAGQHKAAMLALTSVEDILAYDITVGW